MLHLKEEREKHTITMMQIARQAGIDFCEVFRFDIGAFLLMTVADMEKVVKALSTLTNHPYQLSDFFVPSEDHTPFNPLMNALGVRAGTEPPSLTHQILLDTEWMQQRTKTQQQITCQNTQDIWKAGQDKHE